MNFITRVIIYLFLIVSPAKSEEVYKLNFSRFFKIELENNEKKKFIKNLAKAYIHEEDGNSIYIKQQYKKWFNGKLTLKEKNIIKKYKIKLRLHGDHKSHIQMAKNRMSLKIKIIDDTINGVRVFRLFLPETRNGTNEIYANLLFSKIGFPTFYTKMVNVSFLNQEYKAIFQETGSKEFLERNGLSEVPIIKVGELPKHINRKFVRKKLVPVTYINNSSGILKKKNSITTINEAIYLMNSKNFKNMIFQNKLFEETLKEMSNVEYVHGLIVYNRKFIYLPVNRIFIPLYYDGNVGIKKELKCNYKIQ
ncbi:hypothetical protein OAL69_01035, partial [Pelagibacteraceae bacterium]|nr:hypothetical protein [Pelagibacteraceae bacterium]